ncbi:MAG: hypothetical protein K8S94_00515 [Planctomycetia bacterium]|nr:hypothetical protein [Planctomycetia bacterium]
MARKIVNRKELRAQADAAEARGKTKAGAKEKATKEKVPKEKKAKAPKKVGEKKAVRKKKVAKEARMKAFWGVFNQGMKRLALFEYADKKAADKKVAELIASSRVHHFVQLIKEPITE